jgi:hypothetical protein
MAETGNFVELNSATYKPRRRVHLFLLNDAMLVAVKKRRQMEMGGKEKLVAEKCFNLSEIVVVDLKDGGGLFAQLSSACPLNRVRRNRMLTVGLDVARTEQCSQGQTWEGIVNIQGRTSRRQENAPKCFQEGCGRGTKQKTK